MGQVGTLTLSVSVPLAKSRIGLFANLKTKMWRNRRLSWYQMFKIERKGMVRIFCYSIKQSSVMPLHTSRSRCM